MVFGAESATGVPRRQRPNLAEGRAPAGNAWLTGRALRGFLTTASLAFYLVSPRVAHAQATARFADAPTAPPTPTPTPTPTAPSEPVSAPPAPAPVPVAPPVPAPVAPPAAVAPAADVPQVGFSRRLALSHLERAELLERRGDIAQALHEYTESIGIDSTLGDAYLRLGALRERTGDAREADLVYSEAMRLTDTRAKALLQRSHLRRAAGASALALSDLEAAAELDDSRALLEELARSYVELHAWSAALAAFRRIAVSASESNDAAGLEIARLEVRALRVLAAETDPSASRPQKHDWVARALRSIARH